MQAVILLGMVPHPTHRLHYVDTGEVQCVPTCIMHDSILISAYCIVGNSYDSISSYDTTIGIAAISACCIFVLLL